MNAFDQTRQDLNVAKDQLRAADAVAANMASLLVGRLQHCSGSDLAKLKRELRDFNITTHGWKK